jgi:hypothetical protein
MQHAKDNIYNCGGMTTGCMQHRSRVRDKNKWILRHRDIVYGGSREVVLLCIGDWWLGILLVDQ